MNELINIKFIKLLKSINSCQNSKEIHERIINFKHQYNIKSEDFKFHYNLADILWKNLKLEEAIYYFKKCITLDPDSENVKLSLKKAKKEKFDLITYLTFENPNIKTTNQIIQCNQNLQKIHTNIALDQKIHNKTIINIYNKIQKIIIDHRLDTELEASQIHRETKIKYDCERHFEIFDNFNVIPENCFECYKIQIKPRSIIELFKLYLLFDKINLQKNLTRKCMIELRPNVKGAYKGYIYCIGLQEAEETIRLLNPILNRTISDKIPREIKRGCSEFALSYPNFKEIDHENIKFMNYNLEWKEKENIIDRRILSRQKKSKIQISSLDGITLKDALVINNWLYFAKEIGDETYKDICSTPIQSDYISKKITPELINNLQA